VEGGSSDPEGDDRSDFQDSGLGSSLSQSAGSPPDLGSPSGLSRGLDATASTADGIISDQRDNLFSDSKRDITV
jgi:hypothetical protein